MKGRKVHEQTFAEMVAALPVTPEPVSRAHEVRPGGINASGEWFTPAGHRLTISDDEIDPNTAAAMVAAGVPVVWDPCGCGDERCGGGTWLTTTQLASLRQAKPPRLRDGVLLRASANGKPIIVVVGDIHWGSQFD